MIMSLVVLLVAPFVLLGLEVPRVLEYCVAGRAAAAFDPGACIS